MPPLPDPYVLVDPDMLEDLMRRQNETYRSLAAATGLGKSPLQRLHRGKQKTCSKEVADRIAAALGKPTSELFRRQAGTKVAAS